MITLPVDDVCWEPWRPTRLEGIFISTDEFKRPILHCELNDMPSSRRFDVNVDDLLEVLRRLNVLPAPAQGEVKK